MADREMSPDERDRLERNAVHDEDAGEGEPERDHSNPADDPNNPTTVPVVVQNPD